MISVRQNARQIPSYTRSGYMTSYRGFGGGPGFGSCGDGGFLNALVGVGQSVYGAVQECREADENPTYDNVVACAQRVGQSAESIANAVCAGMDIDWSSRDSTLEGLEAEEQQAASGAWQGTAESWDANAIIAAREAGEGEVQILRFVGDPRRFALLSRIRRAKEAVENDDGTLFPDDPSVNGGGTSTAAVVVGGAGLAAIAYLLLLR